MDDIAVIVEGGLCRGVYLDGMYREATVYDFDVLEGGSQEEIDALVYDVTALDPSTDLSHDARSYLPDRLLDGR